MAKPPVRLEIPYKFPSLNDYVRACRSNKYAGGKMKRKVQDDIGWYINALPRFDKPITIHFHWIEGNRKRDLDNIMHGMKYILDSMVELGKIEDDDASHVKGFLDTFEYGKEWKVIMEIREVEK